MALIVKPFSFENVDFEGIDPSIHVIDIIVSDPEIQATAVSPATLDGDIYARRRYGKRNITITFVVMLEDAKQRSEVIRKVCAWATDTENGEGVLRIPSRENCKIRAVCTQMPSVSSREFWEVLSITFTAYNPFFEVEEPEAFDIPTNGILSARLKRSGDSARWSITFDPPTSGISPTWSSRREHITLQNIPFGSVTIDSEAKTVKSYNSSIMASVTLGSRFPRFVNGNSVYVRATDGAGGKIYVYARWI